ncbi:MAG: mandelate racemase/muconate lactonizing enzyme family protein [Alphaproteobacteria bacterium]
MTRIGQINIRPLLLPLRQPYHWAFGTKTHFAVNLVEAVADDGTRGYGECTVAPDQAALKLILERLKRHFIGASPYDVAALIRRAFSADYAGHGASVLRAANQVFSGLDMAMWDLQGRLSGRPVHDLFGGSHHERIGYFYFLQGDTPEELAADAAHGAGQGERVFYLKAGRGEALDLATTAAVRREIGDARLRLDANEAWDPQTAITMCRKLERFDIDFIEQPTAAQSIEAMAHVRSAVGIPIVADQAAFTLFDVYEICRLRAADMICIGPREIGGIQPMMKAAAVAEAAGLKICIHSSFTSGITTCAEHHIARAIPNLDDGNQIMWQLLRNDLVATPDLRPHEGWLTLPEAPGLGFTLDEEALVEAEALYHAEAHHPESGRA